MSGPANVLPWSSDTGFFYSIINSGGDVLDERIFTMSAVSDVRFGNMAPSYFAI